MRVLVTEINLSAKHGIHQTMIARGSVGPSRVWRRVAVVVDRGVSEICIGVKEFMRIGESHRRTTRTSTSIWARRTRFCVPTARRGSVSILD
jgi:hypothetical protein